MFKLAFITEILVYKRATCTLTPVVHQARVKEQLVIGLFSILAVLNTSVIAFLVFTADNTREPLPLVLPVGASQVLLSADFKDLKNDVIIYPPLAEINVVVPAKRNYTDCLDALEDGETTSGNYTIHPDGGDPLEVYCDQETDGGGWVVFQRRVNKIVSFRRRDWDDYKDGFGNLAQGGSGWLGLANIRRLVTMPTATRTELRVDLGKGNPNKDLYDTAYAQYRSFSIDDASSNYKLDVSGYSGTAGDSLTLRHSGREFSTFDRDNDEWFENCALYFGGWWYSNCYAANPNGRYADTNTLQGIRWESWQTEQDKSLAFTEMKLRHASQKLIFKYYT